MASDDHVDSAASARPVPSADPTVIGADVAHLTWKSVLLVVQALGTMALLAWVAVQFESVRRVISRARPIESGPIAASLRQWVLHLRCRALRACSCHPTLPARWRPAPGGRPLCCRKPPRIFRRANWMPSWFTN